MNSRKGSFDGSLAGVVVGDSRSMVDDCDGSGVEYNGFKDAEVNVCGKLVVVLVLVVIGIIVLELTMVL